MQSDVLVLPLVNDVGIIKTEPNKLQSYLAAGKPIFGIIDGAGREIIDDHHLGLCANPIDVDDIATKFSQMADFAATHSEMVQLECEQLRGERFNRAHIIDQIISILD